MNDMRERMIEVICDACDGGNPENPCGDKTPKCAVANRVTDALLAAGCVMPRFKVGQEVYALGLNHKAYKVKVCEIRIFAHNIGYGITGEMFTPTITSNLYATAEEAQAALEGK